MKSFISLIVINIIKRRTLLYYKKAYPEASAALDDWYDNFHRSNFSNPQELKKVYGNASIIANHRVVFNLRGNKYRLIIQMNYRALICYVIWFGNHEEYDRINAEKVKFEPKLNR